MQIFVRQLDGTTNLTEVNNLDALVGEFSDEQCYLAVGGVPLENEEQLSENCTVEMLARLPGGKVHGSLARAGKVRNQTPKVEKNEDKRKKLTGRAKRRQQYTKRFINVVVGPGKKRGPNSNAK
ncbi:ubiquitin-like FUBI-ribosomal protein eS30 fusion protein [Convolutriloba macropyga]|uniref:ubiquitin-like FUBI-ribosomal protein eS30 fusion protein n=1 Tax=Convolutriloba macropyga TaxID=536237 RepID=UPI003F51B7AB